MTTKRHRAGLQRRRGLETARRCWEAFVTHGWTHERIAREFRLTQSAVSKALARGEREARAQLRDNVTTHFVLTLQRLEAIFSLAMDGFERSRTGERVRTGSGRKTNAAGAEIERWTAEYREDRIGDPRWLTEARGALSEISRLLGLNGPIKLQPIESDRPHAHLSDDEVRAELVKMLERAGVDPATLVTDSKRVN